MVGCHNYQGVAQTAMLAGIFLGLALILSGDARAEESSRAGHGHVTVSYQYIHVDGFEATAGTIDIGTVDTHALNFELDYYLTDRWTIAVGIPFIRE